MVLTRFKEEAYGMAHGIFTSVRFCNYLAHKSSRFSINARQEGSFKKEDYLFGALAECSAQASLETAVILCAFSCMLLALGALLGSASSGALQELCTKAASHIISSLDEIRDIALF